MGLPFSTEVAATASLLRHIAAAELAEFRQNNLIQPTLEPGRVDCGEHLVRQSKHGICSCSWLTLGPIAGALPWLPNADGRLERKASNRIHWGGCNGQCVSSRVLWRILVLPVVDDT